MNNFSKLFSPSFLALFNNSWLNWIFFRKFYSKTCATPSYSCKTFSNPSYSFQTLTIPYFLFKICSTSSYSYKTFSSSFNFFITFSYPSYFFQIFSSYSFRPFLSPLYFFKASPSPISILFLQNLLFSIFFH